MLKKLVPGDINSQNEKSGFIKVVTATWVVLYLLVAQQPAKAASNDLNSTKFTKQFDGNYTKQDFSKPIKVQKENSSHLNFYWVAEETKDGETNSYRGVWVSYKSDNVEITWEKWPDYVKGSFVWKVDLNNGSYVKAWASISKYDDYNLWGYDIDYTYRVGGLAVWYGKDFDSFKTNVEVWALLWKFDTSADGVDTSSVDTTYRKYYLEAALRKYFNNQQVDLFWSYSYEKAYDLSDRNVYVSAEYFPLSSVMIHWGWGTADHSKNTKLFVWLTYTFGDGKISPYAWASYANWHGDVSIKFEEWVANRPLSLKNEFEGSVRTNEVLNNPVFRKKAEENTKESFEKNEKLPWQVESILWPTEIDLGKTATYTVEIDSDKVDPSKLTYTWKLDWNELSKGVWLQKLDLTFNTEGTHTLEVIVSDGKVTTSKTLKVKVNAETIVEPTFTLDVTSTWGSASISETDTTVNIDFTGSSSELTLTLHSTEGGYIEIVWTDGSVRRLNDGESTTYDSRDTSKSWEVKYFDKDGNLIKTKTLNLNVI